MEARDQTEVSSGDGKCPKALFFPSNRNSEPILYLKKFTRDIEKLAPVKLYGSHIICFSEAKVNQLSPLPKSQPSLAPCLLIVRKWPPGCREDVNV